jgi:hypothetical protein
MELETVPTSINEVRSRRADLHAILVDIEQAIAAAVPGREDAWTDLVRTRFERLIPAFEEHVAHTQGPDGLFERVRSRSPRLDVNCRRLEAEHATIADQIATVRTALDSDPEHIRSAMLDLLRQLVRHRQGGADLVYEAYAVDIGGSE